MTYTTLMRVNRLRVFRPRTVAEVSTSLMRFSLDDSCVAFWSGPVQSSPELVHGEIDRPKGATTGCAILPNALALPETARLSQPVPVISRVRFFGRQLANIWVVRGPGCRAAILTTRPPLMQQCTPFMSYTEELWNPISGFGTRTVTAFVGLSRSGSQRKGSG